ncbi:GNAT family N-acetyltransferase [Polynucleobacter sp. MWH-Svant-W18]|uniref:GNAT family N-acetyltransferase n=1 Tax=Polynucleobacter sp. MWH-Svant-W18 TaxID=1855909 RepID=UPI002040A6CB|nr:GNAT family N-acetyltransferase [Polynucleobacter sp. MWH-Svant-W18]
MEIVIKSWQQAFEEAFSIRREVFIEEQGVPEAMEIDEFDPPSRHALAYVNTLGVGTARLVKINTHQAQIGRMAVLIAFRKQGIGTALLSSLMDLAKAEGLQTLSLHAQAYAIPFYEKHGFVADGPVYDEAGIPHRNMMLLLPQNT